MIDFHTCAPIRIKYLYDTVFWVQTCAKKMFTTVRPDRRSTVILSNQKKVFIWHCVLIGWVQTCTQMFYDCKAK